MTEVTDLRPIELTARLMALADQVPPEARFADVGTDHARLPVFLLERGVISKAIATDLREGPLERAKWTTRRHGLTECVSFRLGSGLTPLQPGEADVIAIAGMGGDTIIKIMSEAPWARTEHLTFLLQPMTSTSDLRTWLSGHGWSICLETLAKEGETLYTILNVRFGAMPPLTPAETWVGRQYQGMDAPRRREYIALMTDRAERALEGIRRSTRSEDAVRCGELEQLCAGLKSMREEWDTWQR